MWRLVQLHLIQFKNYSVFTHSFQSNCVAITGPNGSGKTNLLDAMYYLAFTKSKFSGTDLQNSAFGKGGFRIAGTFQKGEEKIELVLIVRETGKKELTWNGVPYTRMSDHIGKLPLVMIAPDDISLITESSEERRRWLDALISQINPTYLQYLIAYNKLLTQRNSLLKQGLEQRNIDFTLLDILDNQLAENGNYIGGIRQNFCSEIIPAICRYYSLLAGDTDGLSIYYQSALTSNTMEELLQQYRLKDVASGRTLAGIHKDDLLFNMGERPFKNMASQGQRKSLLFAMKLAEMETLKQHNGYPPLLLLDDVFEKLDEQRMHQLLQYVTAHNAGQTFLTDTHKERMQAILSKLIDDYELITTQLSIKENI